MTLLQTLLLAIIQGITELFPISSLGHTVIMPALFGWPIDQHAPDFLPFVVGTKYIADHGIGIEACLTSNVQTGAVAHIEAHPLPALLEAGVRIHLYKPRFLHAKHLSIDDQVALIGSTNMDMRSFALQCEVRLLVYNEATVKALHAVQQRYFAGAPVLTLEEWRRRPAAVRLLQNMARLVDAVL